MEHTQPYCLQSINNAVATVLLNRPDQFNPLSEGMLKALQECFDQIAQDPNIRIVILAAQGKAFCAGHDLKEIKAQQDSIFCQQLFAQCSKLMLTIQRMPQPVIARVQGVATAAGCQLVAMCDLAIASAKARFAASGIKYGLFCSTPAVPLSRNIGRKKAMEMLLTGEFISAEKACAYGLINEVVADDDLDFAIAQLTSSILQNPASSIALGKRLFYQQLEMGIEAAYQLAEHTMVSNILNSEGVEGICAFVEKRKPNW